MQRSARGMERTPMIPAVIESHSHEHGMVRGPAIASGGHWLRERSPPPRFTFFVFVWSSTVLQMYGSAIADARRALMDVGGQPPNANTALMQILENAVQATSVNHCYMELSQRRCVSA